MTLDEVFDETAIDPWFLAQIEELVDIEDAARGARRWPSLSAAETARPEAARASPTGASPSCWRRTEHAVRERRHALGVAPVYKRVDTCAAEFEATPPTCTRPTNDERVRGRADRPHARS